MRMIVVLPAPLGPSRDRTVPASTDLHLQGQHRLLLPQGHQARVADVPHGCLAARPDRPYAPDTTIKLTQALGAGPSAVPGEGAVNWKIMLKGDALLTATDAAGNTATATCKVPPKSK